MAERYDGPALVHVGFPKTGTTALQNDLFSRADCGMGLPAGDASRACLVDWFIASDGYLYDPQSVADEMAGHEAPLRAKGLLPVWSDETMVGDPLQRRYDGPVTLDRLAGLDRPFKILVTVREQRAMALSLYREFVKGGGAHGLTDFIGTGRESRSFTPILRPDYLFYDRAVTAWAARFGAGNVLVLPYETLSRDPALFLARLAEFLDLDLPDLTRPARHNIGTGAVALGLRRRLNRLIVRSPLGQHRSLTDRVLQRAVGLTNRVGPAVLNERAEAQLRARVAARYDGVFAQSNRALEAAIGQDLRAYGYQ